MNSAASDIKTLLEKKRVVTHYQPLVSIKKRALLGYEALSRGCDECGDVIMAPNLLFALPRCARERLLLDRLCREKALQGFQQVHLQQRELVLSLNMDVSLLDTDAAGSQYLVHQAEQWGIDPNNIVIEIIESDVKNTEALLDFIQRYRDAGFLIALDDLGAGHSNMERIALIKPDVIKIDRSLSNAIHGQFYKIEVAKSLVGLGQRIGAMVVAEGVESPEDALRLLELGVDVFQGFHFARPALLNGRPRKALEIVDDIAAQFKEHSLRSISAKKELYATYDTILQQLIVKLVGASERDYDKTLAAFICAHPDLECLYVLDRRGMQISDTMCNPVNISENKRFIYQPAQRGTDHSLKDYFLPLDAGLPKFTTETYISQASGNLCTTIAACFSGKDGLKRIVCMDISQKTTR